MIKVNFLGLDPTSKITSELPEQIQTEEFPLFTHWGRSEKSFEAPYDSGEEGGLGAGRNLETCPRNDDVFFSVPRMRCLLSNQLKERSSSDSFDSLKQRGADLARQ